MTVKTGGIPRYRSYLGPALFRQGFRPFFLGAGVWALVAVGVWIVILQGTISLPTAFDYVSWHAHEMIFGFLTAVVAGFLLTAIPNWTGRMPLQGPSLVVLFGVWFLGRIAVGTSDLVGPILAAIVDLSFLALFLGVVLREIIAGRNWRNLPMPLALGGLFIANLLTHADVTGLATTSDLGRRLGIAIIVLLISLVGGRIIPSFTRNWLKKRGETRMPSPFGRFDTVCLATVFAALSIWLVAPDSTHAGAMLMAAGAMSFFRLMRWRGDLAPENPLVWSLHLGFAWLPLGLVLLGLSPLVPDLSPTVGIHALTAGAMGTMTLAVMTRAILGHTGRPLIADRWIAALFLLVTAGAVCRVAAPFLDEVFLQLIWASGLFWIAAFGIFSGRFGRLLLSR